MSDQPKPIDTSHLSEDERYVCLMKGTEAPFSGKYYHHHEVGTYTCKCCDAPLFTSDTKYESGSGWPSFFQPISAEAVATYSDTSHGMVREEIVCGQCGSHLGHVFPDGPAPTGLRFCVNSLSLNFHANP